MARARRTAELAGFADATPDDDLREWDYGDYEGLATAQIRERDPGWSVWTHPCPGGEDEAAVAARLDRVVARARGAGRTLVFAHGHCLRALAARWLDLPASSGRLLRLDTGTLSVLGHEHEWPAVARWNS